MVMCDSKGSIIGAPLAPRRGSDAKETENNVNEIVSGISRMINAPFRLKNFFELQVVSSGLKCSFYHFVHLFLPFSLIIHHIAA